MSLCQQHPRGGQGTLRKAQLSARSRTAGGDKDLVTSAPVHPSPSPHSPATGLSRLHPAPSLSEKWATDTIWTKEQINITRQVTATHANCPQLLGGSG